MTPSKASEKRIEELITLLGEIHAQEDFSRDLLETFKKKYGALTRDEKPDLFARLIRRLEVSKGEIEGELRLLLDAEDEDPVRWSSLITGLRKRLESPRMHAFRKFLGISGGLKFLLDFRADVIAAQRQSGLDLETLDEEIAHLFNSWFQQGFLYLKEITQESSYRQILFLKDHDMVHPMTSLEEMGNRLGGDRRCFALYHYIMPDEPVVFIEVALTKGIAKSIHDVLRPPEEAYERQAEADTAIFYSINNTQNGLAGLGLGKVLIFQVVDALKKDHPGIKTFGTLSPIPGFWERYLKRVLEGDYDAFAVNQEKMKDFFPEKTRQALMDRYEARTSVKPAVFEKTLIEILSDPQWIDDPIYQKWLEKPLTDAAYFYITREKNRRGKPLNPVANFHMGNGATVSARNIHFGANRTPRGLAESCGMMVNYLYSSSWLRQISLTVQSVLPWRI